MMEHSRYVAWEDIRQAAPAFLTIILMPLTYSVAYGVMAGLVSFRNWRAEQELSRWLPDFEIIQQHLSSSTSSRPWIQP